MESTTKTRAEMQNEALAIENLLESAMSLFGVGAHQDVIDMVDKAHDRATALGSALDSVNAPAAPEVVKRQNDELNDAHNCIHDLGNLTAALQTMCWQLCQHDMGGDEGLIELRDGVIGLGNAMEARIKQSMLGAAA